MIFGVIVLRVKRVYLQISLHLQDNHLTLVVFPAILTFRVKSATFKVYKLACGVTYQGVPSNKCSITIFISLANKPRLAPTSIVSIFSPCNSLPCWGVKINVPSSP